MMDNRARQNLFLFGGSSGGNNNAVEYQPPHQEQDLTEKELLAQMQAVAQQLEPNPIDPSQEQQQDGIPSVLQRYLQQQQLLQQMQQQEQFMANFQQQQMMASTPLEQALQMQMSTVPSTQGNMINNNSNGNGFNFMEALQLQQQQSFNTMNNNGTYDNINNNDNLFALVSQAQHQDQVDLAAALQPRGFAPHQTALTLDNACNNSNFSPPQQPHQAGSHTDFSSAGVVSAPLVSAGASTAYEATNPQPHVASSSSLGDTSKEGVADFYAENGMLGPWSATSQALLGSMAYDAASKSNAAPKKARTSNKKCKDKPKRPLSAYNIFFKEERQRILATLPEAPPPPSPSPDDEQPTKKKRKRAHTPHHKIGFENLAKMVGERWHDLDAESADYYRRKAEEDTVRYRSEMEVYLAKQADAARNYSGGSDNDSQGTGGTNSSSA